MTSELRRVPGLILIGLVALTTAVCASTGTAGSAGSAAVAAPDPLNAVYKIEKDTITLANGRAEREAAPGSASKIVTTLTDRRVTGDVDGDGRPDTVVVLTHQPGGSGTFYYVAALLNGAGGVTATPGILLGDRITVSAVRLDGRTVVVDILERAAGQPFAASPSVASTKRFIVDKGALAAQ